MGLTTSFVGVDEQAMGNGDADETLPIDTWLQRRIQYNNQQLLAPRAGICWSPISGSAGTWTTHTGNRPYCAFMWHTVWYGQVQVLKDQTHIDITFAYQCAAPGSATAAGVVYVAVTCDDGTDTKKTGGEAMAATYSAGIKVGHQTITIKLAERVRASRMMRLVIWTKSDSTVAVATIIGDAGDGTTDVLRHLGTRLRDTDATGDGFFDPNSAGGPPDNDSLEAMYVRGGTHPTWPGATGQKYDLLWTADITAQGTVAGTLQETANDPNTDAPGTADMHQCLMVRAIFFRPIFGSVAVSYAASAIIPAIQFAPNQEFGSAEAAAQAAAVIRAYRQPTVALIGPKGKWHDVAYTEQDLDPFAAQGYAAHWPTIMGDFTDGANGDHTDLINEGFYLRTENPRLELVCQWLSVQHGAPWNQNQLRSGTQKDERRSKGGGAFDKIDVIDTGGPGGAKWTLTASVHQLADAAAASGPGVWATDITEYGTLSETVDIPVYGADVIGGDASQPPVLRGVDSMEQTGKGSTLGTGFWFKEGSLFEQDVAAGLVHETRHTIILTGLTQTEVLKPFRIKLNMDDPDFYDPVKEGQLAPLSKLRLSLVSFTITEQPEDP